MAINDSTNKYTSNTIVVDTAGTTPFTTIASAITAAVDLGQPTTIYIRPGTYAENLTLVDGISFIGANSGTTTINGRHTIPAAGYFKMQNLKLAQTTPATDVFIEAGAGTCGMQLSNCIFSINSGMIFNLPLSTGSISLESCSDISTQNSIITNITGKSQFYVYDSTVGVGVVAALINGRTGLFKATIGCPVTIGSNSLFQARYCTFNAAVTANDTAALSLYYTKFVTGASAAITVNAGTSALINDCIINSSAANIVTGAGTVTYGQLIATNAFTHNATTEAYTTRTITGSLQLDEANAGVPYFTAGVMGSTAALTNGQLLIGNTGNPPSVATISAGSGIAVTNGAGTVSIASTAPFTWTQINADGALVVNQGSVNIKAGLLTMSLPAASAVNTVIELVGVGAGGWTITQAANQQILVGNTNTTLGAGGTLSSTDKGDCVSMVCTTADLVWRVFGMVGNLTVV